MAVNKLTLHILSAGYHKWHNLSHTSVIPFDLNLLLGNCKDTLNRRTAVHFLVTGNNLRNIEKESTIYE